MTTEDHIPGPEKGLLPEQRVGAAMRRARGLSGLSLRQMARRLGYHSHTTLSSYERGAVMPTDEVVRSYEQLLDLEAGSLAGILEDARIERHGDAWAKRRARLPSDLRQPDSAAAAETRPPQPAGRQRRRRWIVLGAAAVLAASGVALGRQDPKVTGCAIGASTAAQVDVCSPLRSFLGVLQLRTSSRCGTSWGRFIPALTLARKPSLTIEIDVFRPADHAAAKFRIPLPGKMSTATCW